MKKGLAYMLLGAGVSVGAMYAYNQYKNGNMQKTFNDMKNQAQNKLGNMM